LVKAGSSKEGFIISVFWDDLGETYKDIGVDVNNVAQLNLWGLGMPPSAI
jgi:hypothetical protein